MEVAVAIWRLIFVPEWIEFPLIDPWCDFVTKHGKAVTRDTWEMTLELVFSMKDKYDPTDKELKWFDPYGAWPSVIDEFVDNLKK